MILARVAVAKSSRSAASSEDLPGTFSRACRKTAHRTGAVSSLSDLCSPHDAYAPCPLLAEQRLASHRLLFTDIRLPGTMDGWGLAEAARALHLDLPVIYATGFTTEGPRLVPKSVFLQKPYRPSAVLSVIEKLTGEQTR